MDTPSQTPYHQYLAQLHRLIAGHFDEQDLRTLCFALGVSYDDLPARGNANVARELIIRLHNIDRLPELIAELCRQRPAITWADLPNSSDAAPFTLPPEWGAQPGMHVGGSAVGGNVAIGEGGEFVGRDKFNAGGDIVQGNKQSAGGDIVGDDKTTVGNIGAGATVAIGKGATAVTHIHPSPEPIVQRLHELEAPPADFTGREAELAKLLAQVKRGGATITGLRGMGGIGKTALAFKLAEQLTEQYPDAQFLLDLQGTTTPLTPTEAMAHVVRAYHPNVKLPEDIRELQGLYRSVLHGQRALLLMDNAAGREQVEPLLPPASCLLLITSRQHFALPGLRALNLDTLPESDACALLLRIAERIDGHAGEVAQLCGYLPMALRVSASTLAERVTISVDAYIKKLQDAQKRLELVDASLSLSYDLLTPELQRLWRVLAVFPATFDLPAATAVWGVEADAAQDALDELVRYSLVEWSEKASRCSLHDLVRLYATSCLADDEQNEAKHRHAMHYASVLHAANNLYLQGSENILRGLALFDLEWPNIQAGHVWAVANIEQGTAAVQLCSRYPNAGVYILSLRLHPRERIRWLEAALTAARQSKDRSAEGTHLGNLGIAYAALGDARKAIEYHEQALVIAREIGNRRGEGQALNNLGSAYHSLGDARKAIEFYEQHLTISREIGDCWEEGAALGNLGLAYFNLGDARKAIEFYEQRLVIAGEMGDRRGIGIALCNLGNAYHSLGDARKAIEFYEQQLTIAREIGDLRGEGNALGNLGLAYYSLGGARKAIEF